MEKAIAIITARGGSKRIPRKNIKEFAESQLLHIQLKLRKEWQVFRNHGINR